MEAGPARPGRTEGLVYHDSRNCVGGEGTGESPSALDHTELSLTQEEKLEIGFRGAGHVRFYRGELLFWGQREGGRGV